MRRKKGHAEHENAERWLLTYADMITLLVAFFIMLYAMSIVSKQKFQVLALSVRSGFDGNTRMQAMQMSPGTGIAMGNALISTDNISPQDFRIHGTPRTAAQIRSDERRDAKAAVEEQSMSRIRKKIEAAAAAHGLQGTVDVIENQRGLVIRILTDKLLFAKGDGHLQTDNDWLLDVVGSAISKVPNDITVEGHTDNLPIHTAEYPSNWELSTARATSVLRYLIEHAHVDPSRVCAAGYADTHPLVPNTSEANRSRNRRVDIVVLRSAYGTPDE